MLTGFKVSLLVSAFYRPENKANRGALKWNLKFLGYKDEINQQLELKE